MVTNSIVGSPLNTIIEESNPPNNNEKQVTKSSISSDEKRAERKARKKSRKEKKQEKKLDQGTVEGTTAPSKNESNTEKARKMDDKEESTTTSSKKTSSKKSKSKTIKVKEPAKRASIEPPGTPPVDAQAQNMHSWNQVVESGQQTIKKANKNIEQNTDNKNAFSGDEKEEIEIIRELFGQPLHKLKQKLGKCKSSRLDEYYNETLVNREAPLSYSDLTFPLQLGLQS